MGQVQVELDRETAAAVHQGNTPEPLKSTLEVFNASLHAIGHAGAGALEDMFIAETPNGADLRAIADAFRATDGVRAAYVKPADEAAA